MKRILIHSLRSWRNSPIRKPLILKGARQVGKTHLVRQFAEEFDSFVEINFEKQPDAIAVFEKDLEPIRILRELSFIAEKEIIPGKTLLFLDEAQEAPRTLLALRYFYEDMPLQHVIAAGSLLDFAIDQVGVPVGRVTFRYLYPMSFIEFLVAYGQELLAKEIFLHRPEEPLSEVIHNKVIRLLGEYMAIGGMPVVVQQWVHDQNIPACQELLDTIKRGYVDDFAKYAKEHQIKYVATVFQEMPVLIGSHFKYNQLSGDYRRRELEPALQLLNKANVLHCVYHTLGQGIPLGAQANLDKYKVIMLDVALTQSILKLNIKDWFLNSEMSFVNKGNLAEAFIGQELLAYSDPHDSAQLYYWHREAKNSNAEVDYLIVVGSNIIPVEVKSGKGSSLKSMHMFLQQNPKTVHGIRFSTHNYSTFDRVVSYPLYAVAAAMGERSLLHAFLNMQEG